LTFPTISKKWKRNFWTSPRTFTEDITSRGPRVVVSGDIDDAPDDEGYDPDLDEDDDL
jgi:hypothetical protein